MVELIRSDVRVEVVSREFGRWKEDRVLGMIGSLRRRIEEESEVRIVLGLWNV